MSVWWSLGRRGPWGPMIALIGFVTLGATQAAASTPAEKVVAELASRVWEVLHRSDLEPADRHARLVEIIEAHTDVELLGRLVLGRHWRRLDGAQKQSYDRLFRAVVIGSLGRRLAQLSSDSSVSLEDRFHLLGSQPAGRTDVLVRSKVVPDRGQEVALDWRLRQRSGRIVVIDLAIAGVSMLVSQRSEFAAVIERGDLEGLLAELEARAQATGS